jgi:hypothetical protein
MVTRVCNVSYLGGRGQKDRSSRPAQAKKLARPHLKEKIWAWQSVPVIQAMGKA